MLLEVIQLFKLLGYSTIIAYASAHHTDYLKSIGATHVIERGEVPVGSLAEAAKKIANAPIEIAYNAVGDKDSQAACIDAIIEGGQVPDVNPEVVENEDSKNGKRVFTIFATPHHPPHREFCRILWKTLPNLVQKGVIVVSKNLLNLCYTMLNCDSPTGWRNFPMDSPESTKGYRS